MVRLAYLTILYLCFACGVKGQHDNFPESPRKKNRDVIAPDEDDGGGGILWENLTCSTQNGDHVILHKTFGFVPNGHVCGILGPSGSGKSTFLSILAGRPESSLRIDGRVLHPYPSSTDSVAKDNTNDKNNSTTTTTDSSSTTTSSSSGSVAWLQQQDGFFDRLTVQETIDLAVFLEWPNLDLIQRKEIARTCLETLGLSKIQSRQIGGRRGGGGTENGAKLSGGEMRRLSVALELVTNPYLFLADEATTGIDSKMSEKVMAAILGMVQERHIPCFCTLHQPRSSIWHMLDAILLMAPGGRVVYMGPTKDIIAYFSTLGYTCPNDTNPAEYFIDLVSINPENPYQAQRDRERIDQLTAAYSVHLQQQQQQQQQASSSASTAINSHDKAAVFHNNNVPGRRRRRSNSIRTRQARPSFGIVVRRFGALVRRSWRQTIRSTSLNVFRLILSTGTALLLSQIFPSVAAGFGYNNENNNHRNTSNKSVSDRICVLTFGSINMFLIALVKTLGIFAKESPVVQREKTRRGDYTNHEYILSKAFVEIPFDASFAVVFATTLKLVTKLTIGWQRLSSIFALMTVAGASLGFFLGSCTSQSGGGGEEAAVAIAMPVVILLMVVGVLNPSGVDSIKATATPRLVRYIKAYSPIASAIEGLVVAEFRGQKFVSPSMFDMERYRDLPRMGGLALVKSGDETLEALGLQGVSFNAVLSQMWFQSLINLTLCWLGLRLADLGWFKQAGAFLSRQRDRILMMGKKEHRNRMKNRKVSLKSPKIQRKGKRQPSSNPRNALTQNDSLPSHRRIVSAQSL